MSAWAMPSRRFIPPERSLQRAVALLGEAHLFQERIHLRFPLRHWHDPGETGAVVEEFPCFQLGEDIQFLGQIPEHGADFGSVPAEVMAADGHLAGGRVPGG